VFTGLVRVPVTFLQIAFYCETPRIDAAHHDT
jgi:hypothetical protein